MTEWEEDLFYSNLKYCDRLSWEQTRVISYILAQTNSKKKLDITDILHFPWDDNFEEHDTEITDEEKNKLRAKAKMFEKMLQQNSKQDS